MKNIYVSLVRFVLLPNIRLSNLARSIDIVFVGVTTCKVYGPASPRFKLARVTIEVMDESN